MAGSDNTGKGAGADRRGAPRTRILRKTLLSPWAEHTHQRQGVAVDISATGFRIHTRTPIPVGLPLEIELLPRQEDPAGHPVIVRGTVVWTTKLPSGESAMGIQLNAMRGPLTAPAGPQPDRPREEILASEIRERLQSWKSEKIAASHPAGSVARESVKEEEETAVRFRAIRPRRRYGRWLLMLALLLFLLGLLYAFHGSITLPKIGYTGSSGPGYRTTSKASDKPGTPTPEEQAKDARGGNGSVSPASFSGLSVGELLDDAMAGLFNQDPGTAQTQFEAVLTRSESSAVERFISRLGRSMALKAEDQPREAMSVLTEALTNRQGVPEPWSAFAEQFRKLLAAGVTTDLGSILFRGSLEVEPWSAAPDSEANTKQKKAKKTSEDSEESSGIRIVIHTEQYVLEVLDGNRVVGAFPVGLGRGRSTPQGKFRIANKITNPDWCNRGQVVKSGDPKNPLGRQWMGLGDAEGPTSVGIHPTNESESIGQNMSRGCVRMRPQDAERVFALCEIGTPVSIQQ